MASVEAKLEAVDGVTDARVTLGPPAGAEVDYDASLATLDELEAAVASAGSSRDPYTVTCVEDR